MRNLWGIEETDLMTLFVSMNFDIKRLDALMATAAEVKLNNHSRKDKFADRGKR
jgi:hypothetical protein